MLFAHGLLSCGWMGMMGGWLARGQGQIYGWPTCLLPSEVMELVVADRLMDRGRQMWWAVLLWRWIGRLWLGWRCWPASETRDLLAEGEDGGLLADARRRRRVTKGCCPSPFEVFASEINYSLAGSEMLALLPGRWDRIQRVVLVILGGSDRPTGRPAGARRRQPWLSALVRVMEHHTGAPAVHRKSCTCNV
ncbi:hypothetical protein ACLOJK_037009 [Asimina triloba]